MFLVGMSGAVAELRGLLASSGQGFPHAARPYISRNSNRHFSAKALNGFTCFSRAAVSISSMLLLCSPYFEMSVLTKSSAASRTLSDAKSLIRSHERIHGN
jgi:hypothetical protein